MWSYIPLCCEPSFPHLLQHWSPVTSSLDFLLNSNAMILKASFIGFFPSVIKCLNCFHSAMSSSTCASSHLTNLYYEQVLSCCTPLELDSLRSLMMELGVSGLLKHSVERVFIGVDSLNKSCRIPLPYPHLHIKTISKNKH